jgi:hypothetical protein
MLPNVQVASPCTADWEGMMGDSRVRHCAQCNLNVYNFSEMTSGEIAQLIAASKGQRLCGRLYRRVDGTILTSDCPVGVRVRIRRVSRRVGTAFAAAMTATVAAAQTARPQPLSLAQIQQAETGVELVLFDENRAVIGTAQVNVASRSGKQVATGRTNGSGRVRFSNLPPDEYFLTIQVSGFNTAKIAVTVPTQQMVAVDATLQVGPAATVGGIIDYEQPLVETQPSSTFQLIPERALPTAPSTETSGAPQPTVRPKNPLRKFFLSLEHVLNR